MVKIVPVNFVFAVCATHIRRDETTTMVRTGRKLNANGQRDKPMQQQAN
jgi:hypothetical protein